MAVTPALPEDTDYKSMGPEMGTRCGDNAQNWATAYCQITNTRESWGVVVSWFANVIECSQDARHATGPTVLPDGSAFFVAATQG